MTESTSPGQNQRVIGVFDSGFGGLTVLRALLPRLPETHFVYLGDTARLPYGAKSQATVARYAVEAARFLVSRNAELLVIACNTATALALPQIRAAVPVPVIGVVEPGAKAALAAVSSPLLTSTAANSSVISTEPAQQLVISTEAKRSGEICVPNARAKGTSQHDVLVLATAATVQSHAYRDTCTALGLRVEEKACPLLVPLVEEGWTDHPVTREVLRIYLTEALAESHPHTVLLGCTHYPLIASAVTETLRELGCNATVVDSAEATAEAVRATLDPGAPSSPTALPSAKVGSQNAHRTTNAATFECYATDSVEKFARLGTRFLGHPIPHVELLDLGG